jgi:hypothetical protein
VMYASAYKVHHQQNRHRHFHQIVGPVAQVGLTGMN